MSEIRIISSFQKVRLFTIFLKHAIDDILILRNCEKMHNSTFMMPSNKNPRFFSLFQKKKKSYAYKKKQQLRLSAICQAFS